MSLMSSQGRYHEDVFGATQQASINSAKAAASKGDKHAGMLDAAHNKDLEGVALGRFTGLMMPQQAPALPLMAVP